jgi:hypothetical protein
MNHACQLLANNQYSELLSGLDERFFDELPSSPEGAEHQPELPDEAERGSDVFFFVIVIRTPEIYFLLYL